MFPQLQLGSIIMAMMQICKTALSEQPIYVSLLRIGGITVGAQVLGA